MYFRRCRRRRGRAGRWRRRTGCGGAPGSGELPREHRDVAELDLHVGAVSVVSDQHPVSALPARRADPADVRGWGVPECYRRVSPGGHAEIEDVERDVVVVVL